MEIPCWVHFKSVHQDGPGRQHQEALQWNEASGMPHNFMGVRVLFLLGLVAAMDFNRTVPRARGADPHQNNPKYMWHASQLVRMPHHIQMRFTLESADEKIDKDASSNDAYACLY